MVEIALSRYSAGAHLLLLAGRNDDYQLSGLTSLLVPVQVVPGLIWYNYTDISAGYAHTCGVHGGGGGIAAGAAVCWGEWRPAG